MAHASFATKQAIFESMKATRHGLGQLPKHHLDDEIALSVFEINQLLGFHALNRMGAKCRATIEPLPDLPGLGIAGNSR